MNPQASGTADNSLLETTCLERRAATRYPCDVAVCCRILGDAADGTWLARLRDVSVTGISLFLPARLERGTLLLVDLQEEIPGFPRSLSALAIHASPSEDEYLVGCALAEPLEEHELQALLQVRSF